VAHRGIHNSEIPENSIAAFKLAIENNLTIELDIRLTKDNKIVVLHDETLFRMTGIDKKVCDCNYEDVKRLKLLNTDNNIPTFKEVLQIIDGKVPIVIEIKNEGRVGELEDRFLDMIKEYKGKYIVESFNPLSLIYLKNKNREVVRGQLVCYEYENVGKLKSFILRHMFLNILSKPQFLSYKIEDITEKIAKRYCKYKLFAWTIQSKQQYIKCKELGTNCIFDSISIDEIKQIDLEREKK